jgi:glycosyltransferase involved in cell wall biosynthesis
MNTISQPLVSIVTPVYNEEEYLAECIESVLAQTYQNWDYTIVNNCSTDRSLEIARSYAANDPRIRIHDNAQFLDMIPNHNVALRQISPESKYCKVVLGDDRIFPECLERMVAVAEIYPCVGIVSSYQLHGQQVRSKGLPSEQTFISGREACRQFLLGKLALFGTQNSVLYRADLVRGRCPFYVETNICADFEVCFALLKEYDLGFVHQVLTYSRPRPSSIGAIASDTGAHFGSLLDILFSYGKECLNKGEFETCFDLQLSQYYIFLGRRLWVERDEEFWSLHKRAFAKFGINFSHLRLTRVAVVQLLRSGLHPRATVESVWRLFRLRRIRGWRARKVVVLDAVKR